MKQQQSSIDAGSLTPRRSLSVLVREELEGMILQGDLSAGMRLNENLLAERLGVSRGPIREAARLLERDGLVISIANHGVFVRQLTVEDAVELYELRAIIAGLVCSTLAQQAKPAIKAELRDYVDRMDDCIDARDEEKYFLLNLEFHDRIAEASGNARSAALYASLGKEVRLLRRRVLQGEASIRLSNSEHRRIVAAIGAGDAATARKEAEQHHLNGKRRWLETM